MIQDKAVLSAFVLSVVLLITPLLILGSVMLIAWDNLSRLTRNRSRSDIRHLALPI